jgi:hypothetical protein
MAARDAGGLVEGKILRGFEGGGDTAETGARGAVGHEIEPS